MRFIIDFVLKLDLRNSHKFGFFYLRYLGIEKDDTASTRIQGAWIAYAVIMVLADVIR